MFLNAYSKLGGFLNLCGTVILVPISSLLPFQFRKMSCISFRYLREVLIRSGSSLHGQTIGKCVAECLICFPPHRN